MFVLLVNRLPSIDKVDKVDKVGWRGAMFFLRRLVNKDKVRRSVNNDYWENQTIMETLFFSGNLSRMNQTPQNKPY